jgi:hypothetical protein
MLTRPSAMSSRSRVLAFVCLAAAFFDTQVALAQTTGSETVTMSNQLVPDRNVNGQGTSPRPQNLNPTGVSYSDCISDMTLHFNVVVNGFNGTDSMQIWATKSGNCSARTDRINATSPVCWLVNPGFGAKVYNAPTSVGFDVRVQDLVGPQNSPPGNGNYVRQGPSACMAQSTFATVPMTINFVPLDSGGNPVGTLYSYQISTDLVGPPAPTGVSESVGDTFLNVNWVANSDADTAGYDVYVDPIPGQEGTSDATSASAPATMTVLVCPDAGAPLTAIQDSSSDQDSSSEAGDDGSAADATVNAPSQDAGCYFVNVGGTFGGSTGGVCADSLLAQGIVQDGGTVQQFDEAGNLIEGGTSTGGGISTIPPQNRVPGSRDLTVPDKSTGTFTIKGLVNGHTYTAIVAAVDGFGNIGPPSQQVCDFPAPVNDFWKIYRDSGGRAGGGFCALEAVGEPAPVTAGIALLVGASVLGVRRRSRR